MRICVIIPTFNEAREISGIIKALTAKKLDVVVVDDGSRDRTPQLAAAAGATVIQNTKNEGKGAALIKGFHYALKNEFDAVMTMDGDGQHSPDDVDGFIKAAESSEAHLFIGNRMHRPEGMPFVRWVTNTFMSGVISLICKQPVHDSQSGFRLIKCEVLRAVTFQCAKYEIESEMIIATSLHNFKIASVPIHSIYRGEISQINPAKDTLRFLRFIFRELWNMKH